MDFLYGMWKRVVKIAGPEYSEGFTEVPKKEYVTCKLCKQQFHQDTLDLPENMVESLNEIQNYFIWICEKCKKSLDSNASSHSSNTMLETSSTTTSLSNPSFSNAVSNRLSAKETAPKNNCDTKVKIIHAEVVNVSCEKPHKCESHDGLYGSHSEASGKAIERKEEKQNENITQYAKEALKSRLGRTEAYISTISPDGTKLQYPIQDHFAQLNVEEKSFLGFPNMGKTIGIHDIFHTKNKDGIRVKQNILITGDAGFGKTTLAIKLCYDWATLKSPNYMSDFELVVNIPLKKLGCEPVKNVVLNEMFSNGYQKDSMPNELKILIILDGFDETSEKCNVIRFLENPQLPFSGCSVNPTIIVTSRPYAVEEIRHLCDWRLSIAGLTYTNQNLYIRKILPNSKAENLRKDMIKHPFLRKLSECPLILHLLCCVYANDDRSTISSRTEIYLQIFKLLTLSYASKNERTSFSKRIMETPVLENEIFIRFGKVVSQSLLEYERITEDSLKNEFRDKEELEFIHGLGILVVVPVSRNMRVMLTYECLHRTFAEFLASIYFYNIAITSKPNLKALSACTKRLKTGFIASLLGDKIVENEILRNWITEDGLTFSELHQIKIDASLSEHYWKTFCSCVKSIEYDPFDTDSHLLSYRITLPNVCEVKVKFTKIEHSVWIKIQEVVNKLKSCISLVIDLVIEVYYLSCETNDGVCFINMEGIMTKLIHILKFLRVERVSVRVHPQNACNNQFAEKLIVGESQDDERRQKAAKFVGILPTEHPTSSNFDVKEPHLLWKWRFDNMEIEYNSAFRYGDVNSKAIPIIVIAIYEYAELGYFSEYFVFCTTVKIPMKLSGVNDIFHLIP